MSERVLLKRGPLSSEEWGVMRLHPQIGCRIVDRVPGLNRLGPAIRRHQERWDGTGYPSQLAQAEIPLLRASSRLRPRSVRWSRDVRIARPSQWRPPAGRWSTRRYAVRPGGSRDLCRRGPPPATTRLRRAPGRRGARRTRGARPAAARRTPTRPRPGRGDRQRHAPLFPPLPSRVRRVRGRTGSAACATVRRRHGRSL